MSSSGFRRIAVHFHRRNNVLFRVENEDIAEVVAESATIYVDFVFVGY